jgi:hypothetical protein
MTAPVPAPIAVPFSVDVQDARAAIMAPTSKIFFMSVFPSLMLCASQRF